MTAEARARAAPLWRGLWFVLVPALLAALATRFLLPDPGRSAGWPRAARLLVESPLLVAVVLTLILAALARYWRHHLPGAGAQAAVVPAAARSTVRETAGLVVTVAAAGAAALVMRGSCVDSFRVASASMLPTLLPHDRLVANKLAYGVTLPLYGRVGDTQVPRRGDVVLFRNPEPAGPGAPQEVVKRVIGLPGDRIAMRNGRAVINDWPVPTCDAGAYAYPTADGGAAGQLLVEFLEDQAYLTVHTAGAREYPGVYVVKAGEVFVLGDNRNQSVDSRFWGARGAGVPLDRIHGRLARIIGSDRNGATDWSRLWKAPGLEVALPNTDTRQLEAGIARCLGERPRQTRPPAPAAAGS